MGRAAPSPFVAGLSKQCPNCGQAPVFAGYLRFAPACAACGADFSVADSGDGPAVFVVLLVGAVVVPVAFVLQFGLGWPEWAGLGTAAALTVGLSLWLLPIFKATLFALQWRHKAGEAQTSLSGDPDAEGS